MSRMNELSIENDELRNAAAALNSVADSLTQLFSSEEPAKQVPAPKPITKGKSVPNWPPRAQRATECRYAHCSNDTARHSFPL